MTSVPADALEAIYTPGCQNVHFRFGEVRPRPGAIGIGTAGGGSIVWLGYYDVGAKWPIAISEEKIYRRGNTTPCDPEEWYEITGEGFDASQLASETVGEDYFFFTVGDSIYRWDGLGASGYESIPMSEGTGDAIFTDDTPAARYIEYFNNRLILAYTAEVGGEYPYRLRWPENGDHTKWDDTLGEGAGFLDVYDGKGYSVAGIRVLGDKLVVYKPHALLEMVSTGSVELPHSIQPRVDGIGLAAPFTLQSNGYQHFFMAYDRNVYAWDGIRLSPIGDRILSQLQGLTTIDNLPTYSAGILPQRNEYWLILEDGNVFIYDYRADTWTRDVFPDITTVAEIEERRNEVTWDGTFAAARTWETVSERWSELRAEQRVTAYGGRSDGQIFNLDEDYPADYFNIGSIIDCRLETADYYLPDQEGEPDPLMMGRVINVVLIYEYLGSDPFEAAVSVDRGRTWTTQSVTPHVRGYSQVSFNVTGNVVRFRFGENDATGKFRWRQFAFEFVDAGPWRPES